MFTKTRRACLYLQIIFHGTDRDSLHNYLSPKSLPAQYGGTLELPRIEGPQWYKLLSMCEKEYEGNTSQVTELHFLAVNEIYIFDVWHYSGKKSVLLSFNILNLNICSFLKI